MPDDRPSFARQMLEQQRAQQQAAPQPEPVSTTSAIGSGGAEPIRDVAKSALSGLAGVSQDIVGLGALIPGTDVREGGTFGLSHLYQGLGRASQAAADWRSDEARRQIQAVEEAEGFGGTLQAMAENPYSVPLNVMSSMASMLPIGRGARIAGRVAPGLSRAGRVGVAEGTMYAGATAGQVAQENPDSYAARLAAVPAGAVGTAISYTGARVGGIYDPATMIATATGGLTGRAASKTTKEASHRLVRRIFNSASLQAPQEFLQEGAQQAFLNLGTGRPLTEGMVERATMGAVVGAGMGVVSGPFAGMAERRGERNLKGKPTTSPPPTAPAGQSTPAQPSRPIMGRRHANQTRAAIAGLISAVTGEPIETATEWVNERSKEGGAFEQILDGPDGVNQIMDALAIGPHNRDALSFALINMIDSQHAPSAQGARRLVSILTGMKTKDIKNLSEVNPDSLDKYHEALQKRVDTLENMIQFRGGDETAQRRRIEQRDKLKAQQDSLRLYRETAKEIQAAEQAEAEQRRAEAEQEAEAQAQAEQAELFEQEAQEDAVAQAQLAEMTAEEIMLTPEPSDQTSELGVDPADRFERALQERRDAISQSLDAMAAVLAESPDMPVRQAHSRARAAAGGGLAVTLADITTSPALQDMLVERQRTAIEGRRAELSDIAEAVQREIENTDGRISVAQAFQRARRKNPGWEVTALSHLPAPVRNVLTTMREQVRTDPTDQRSLPIGIEAAVNEAMPMPPAPEVAAPQAEPLAAPSEAEPVAPPVVEGPAPQGELGLVNAEEAQAAVASQMQQDAAAGNLRTPAQTLKALGLPFTTLKSIGMEARRELMAQHRELKAQRAGGRPQQARPKSEGQPDPEASGQPQIPAEQTANYEADTNPIADRPLTLEELEASQTLTDVAQLIQIDVDNFVIAPEGIMTEREVLARSLALRNIRELMRRLTPAERLTILRSPDGSDIAQRYAHIRTALRDLGIGRLLTDDTTRTWGRVDEVLNMFEVLDSIVHAEDVGYPLRRAAEAVLEAGREIGATPAVVRHLPHKEHPRYLGVYRKGRQQGGRINDSINLSRPARGVRSSNSADMQTLIHESTHAVTAYAYDILTQKVEQGTATPVEKAVVTVMEKLTAQLEARTAFRGRRGLYATTNPKEMMAEMFSGGAVAAMASTPMDTSSFTVTEMQIVSGEYAPQNLLQTFANVVANILALVAPRTSTRVTSQSILDGVLAATATTVRAQQSYRASHPRARIAPNTPMASMEPSQVEQVVGEFVGQWTNAPEVVLVDNIQSESIPVEVRDSLATPRPGGQPAAIYHNGVVYMNTARMGSAAEVATTLYHEIVGHHGFRGLFGEVMEPILDQLISERRNDIMAIADKYGLDMSDQSQARHAAEEFIAHLSERLHDRSLLSRVVDVIRSALTDTWLGDALGIVSMNDSMIMEQLITPALGFVANGNTQGLTAKQMDAHMLKVQDPGSTPRADMNLDVLFDDTQAKGSLMSSIREAFSNMKQAMTFTETIMDQLQRRIPATRKLAEVLREADTTHNHWERRHQTVGSKYVKLSGTQHQNLIDTLVHYTSLDKTLPFIPEHAMKASFKNGQLLFSRLTSKDVTVDNKVLNQLDAKTKDAVQTTFEVTAEILLDRTRASIQQATAIRDRLLEIGQDATEVQKSYTAAMRNIVRIHNERVSTAYVPTSRHGKFAVEAWSEEYAQKLEEYEASGRDPEIKAELDALKADGHYSLQRYDTATKAQAVRDQLLSEGRWVGAEYSKQMESRPEQSIHDYETIAKMVDYVHQNSLTAGEDVSSQQWAQVQDGLHSMMREVLDEMGQLDAQSASRMHRLGVHGVARSQVLENTLDYMRHYGAVAARSETALQRADAIGEMREELSQLTGRDSSRMVGYFNRLMRRMYEPFDNADGFLDEASRRFMGFSSVYLLLTNPTYYLLNLTQTPMFTAPVLAGEMGARAIPELIKAYNTIRPVYKGIRERGTEITFEGFPERIQDMFRQLQARNILDVGMSHEFGSLHQGKGGAAMQKLYNAARAVELINRSTAAMAGYNLKINQLTKGRKFESFTEAQRNKFHEEAVEYASWVTYKTHGDYSYNNAPEVFRKPVPRAIFQFKKIGLIQAELLYDRAKTAWRKPTLSERASQWLETAQIEGVQPIVDKIQNKKWITEAERAQLESLIREFERSGEPVQRMSPKDQDFIRLLLAEVSHQTFNTLESATVAKKSFAYLIGTSAAVSGTLSVPFATSLLAMMLKWVDDDEDADLDTSAESVIKRVMGPVWGNIVLRGAGANAIKADVSHRVGLNFVEQFGGGVYARFRLSDPQRSTSEAMTGLLGPPASIINDMVKSANYWSQWGETGSDHDLAKAVSAMSPLLIRNIVTAKMLDTNGLVNDARLTLIPPEDFSRAEIVRKAMGFQPSQINEFYDMRQHMDDVVYSVEGKRVLLKRAYYEAMESGNAARINRVMSQWKDLQKAQKQVGIVPSPVSELAQFVRQKRREQQRVVGGLQPSARTHGVAQRISATHRPATPAGQMAYDSLFSAN